MTTASFGVGVQGDKTPAEYAALAQTIDRYPFDVVSVYNDLLFQPALGPLLWMAPYLNRARRIGPAALNPYLVHPVELAGQAALLDHATNGRAYLGLARGAWLSSLRVRQPKPIQTLREAILLIQHLLAGRSEGFDGEIFHHPPHEPLRYKRVRSSVPITVGTWGSKTAAMAAALADEIKIGGSANPAVAARMRNLAGARIGICLGAVTVVDEDRQVARDLARRQVARYLTVVARLDPHDEFNLDHFAFAGTPEDIVSRVEAVFAAGATRVEFGTPLGPDPHAALRLLGERVLPAFT